MGVEPALAALIACMSLATIASADGPPPAPPITQMRAEAMRNAEKPAAPFTLFVEQVIPLAPAGWETLELQRLEVQQVNATSEAARSEIAAQIQELKSRLSDGPCVLLGRGPAQAGGRGVGGTAVLVPAGLGGRSVAPQSSVRVVPSAIPWPPMAVGEASRAYPELRLFGTPARPGFVAQTIEVPKTPADAPAKTPTTTPSTDTAWGRAAAASLAESSQLICDAPIAGTATNRWIPMSVTVRNGSQKALPPSEVFVEFLDSSGQLLHREFRWITERDSAASETRLPALAPGASTTIRVPAPPGIAAKASAARVLIVRLLPAKSA